MHTEQPVALRVPHTRAHCTLYFLPNINMELTRTRIAVLFAVVAFAVGHSLGVLGFTF